MNAEPAEVVPRISLILLTYNQQATARAAAESCVAQRCEPIQIVLSDDASTDGTFEELQRVADAYRGSHLVRARRNPVNLGIGAHYNQLLKETSGALLVTAAGDDLSLPHRVERLAQAWDASGQRLDLISSHFINMRPDGSLAEYVATDDLALLNIDRWCRKRPYSVGATHAFTRRLMDRFDPFIEGVWYEDAIMMLRALTSGGMLTLPEVLVHYRIGGSSEPPRIYDAERFAWMRTQNGRLRVEMRQQVQDARLAGVAAPIEAALVPVLAREDYLSAMMDATSAGERWRALLAAPSSLPLGWRLRKLLNYTVPDQYLRIKMMKERRHGR